MHVPSAQSQKHIAYFEYRNPITIMVRVIFIIFLISWVGVRLSLGSILGRNRNLSLLHSVVNGFGSTQSSIQCVPGAVFEDVKWRRGGEDADYSPPSSAKVNSG
jgi:hypothetical protein